MPDQDDDEEEEGEEEESTLSYSSSWNKSNYSAVKVSKNNGMNVLIKPKERLGQSMQAKTITNKNSLMEIGSYANTDTSFASTTAPADTDNPVNVNLNPPNAASSPKEAFQLSRSDTMKGIKMLQLKKKISRSF